MSKNEYIINGNQLFIIEKINRRKLSIKEINHTLTMKDCRYTYDLTQMKRLGYIIEPNYEV